MTMRWMGTGVVAVAALALVACDSTEPKPSKRSEAEGQTPAQAETAAPEMGPLAEPPPKEVVAPFAVSLEAPA